MEINYLLCGDKNCIKPMCVTMVSAILNNLDSKNNFYIFCYDFDKCEEFIKLENKYKDNCKITCINTTQYNHYFSNQAIEKSSSRWLTIACYLRLLAFKILPSSVDKIIYLDYDIVVNSNLKEIYSFKNNILFKAVAEQAIIKKGKSFHLNKMVSFENWKKDRKKYAYFNDGFFIANIKLAKKLNIFEQIIAFLKENPNPPLADQDTLNAVIGQKYNELMEYLPQAYNVFGDTIYQSFLGKNYFYNDEQLLEAIKNPKIIHYGGPDKPWKNKCILHYYDIWWKYAENLPFKIDKRKNTIIKKMMLFFKKIPLIFYR